jgi:hypothetical protein
MCIVDVLESDALPTEESDRSLIQHFKDASSSHNRDGIFAVADEILTGGLRNQHITPPIAGDLVRRRRIRRDNTVAFSRLEFATGDP